MGDRDLIGGRGFKDQFGIGIDGRFRLGLFDHDFGSSYNPT